jgi:hypothetical protein
MAAANLSRLSKAEGMPVILQGEADNHGHILTIPGIQYNGTLYLHVTMTSTCIVRRGAA